LLPANPIRPIKIGRFDQAAASVGFGSKNIGFAG
jgi:hypothetical protein